MGRSGSTDGAYDVLISQIADGQLAPGTWVREASISQELGISRTPVREALRALAADGLIEIIHNRGARVRNWSSAQIAETYSLRALLEGFGARRAAALATAESTVELHRIHAEMEGVLKERRPGFLDEVADLNGKFHHEVLRMSDSPLLVGFVDTLSSIALVRRAFRGYSEDDLARTLASHRDILLGIDTGSEALAASAMESHILAASHSARSVLHSGRGDQGPSA